MSNAGSDTVRSRRVDGPCFDERSFPRRHNQSACWLTLPAATCTALPLSPRALAHSLADQQFCSLDQLLDTIACLLPEAQPLAIAAELQARGWLYGQSQSSFCLRPH